MNVSLPVPPSDDPYREERRRLLQLRLRASCLMALVPISIAALANAAVISDRLAEHLATLGIQGACCLLGALLTRHPAARRWSIALAVLTTIGVAAAQFWAVALATRDIDVLVGPIAIVMTATALLYPWGFAPQALVSTFVAVGYVWLVDWRLLDAVRAANVLIAVLLGVGVSTCGAWVLDRQRRATFTERERVAALAHQRELLLDSGRRMNATVDLGDLVALIARLGQQIVDCDWVTLTLIEDAPRDSYQVVKAVRGKADVAHVHVPVRGTAAFREAMLARHTLELPSGTEFDHLLDVGGPQMGRILVVAVQREGRLLGLLGMHQPDRTRPFTEQQVRIAEGFAHQAAIALANARLVADLQQASRVKTEFVSTMSHELRTPLNVILGFAEIGLDAGIAPAERTECLVKIDAAGRDLLDLIESTLAIGKLEAGRDLPQMETVQLAEFWQELQGICARLPRHPGVVLAWGDAPAVSLHTDARKLSVVMRNLIGNALKFTELGSVRVHAARDDAGLTIDVTDTGIGIRPEDQTAIFEIFRQGDSSDSRRFGGTGLGLYIVRSYVAQLGGTVALSSTPGTGTTFTVRLPIAGAAARQAA